MSSQYQVVYYRHDCMGTQLHVAGSWLNIHLGIQVIAQIGSGSVKTQEISSVEKIEWAEKYKTIALSLDIPFTEAPAIGDMVNIQLIKRV